MKNNHIKPWAIASLMSTLALGAWSSPALAAPIIQNISIDNGTSPPTISIAGSALCKNASCTSVPKIIINGSTLVPLLGSTQTLLKASWTPPGTPGNYLVRVTNSKGTTTSILTNGAVGATGPQGVPGPGILVHGIGQLYQGGIIFYVDADGQHGLIAAIADQSTGITWYDSNNTKQQYYNNGAKGDGIYAGILNTYAIVAQQNSLNTVNSLITTPTTSVKQVSSAAQVAADYSVQDDGVTACTGASHFNHPPITETCYGDWYLPSKVELNLLYNQRVIVGGFAVNAGTNSYWSSTEILGQDAYVQYFYNGDQYISDKSAPLLVRAVRAF